MRINKLMTDYAVGPGGSLNSLDLSNFVLALYRIFVFWRVGRAYTMGENNDHLLAGAW